ncbi:winged helix-turn-helix transcriptional regulator [Candidatus Woesearchaeota archaeon]|nr:winged helix-turn-helix transcriptional regulator [Candidatus Woesearchaeota archaeon]
MTSIRQLYGYIITSQLRKKIFLLLSKRPFRQSEIAQKLNQKQPNISKALADLEKQEIVECLTPNKKAWKLYELSKIGKDVLTEIKRK